MPRIIKYKDYYANEQSYARWAKERMKPEDVFRDIDLNNWAANARQQGKEYAGMSFDRFSKMVMEIVKETGFQLGNTLLLYFGILLAVGGCGNIFIGVISEKSIGSPILGIILLPIGVYMWFKANKNWDRH